jgi:hypothetical protein
MSSTIASEDTLSSRLSSAAKSSVFQCSDGCEFLESDAFRVSGFVHTARAQVADMTANEMRIKRRADLLNAMRWNSAASRWDYAFNVFFNRVCLGVWVDAFGFNQSTIYRLKNKFEEEANARRESGNVSIASSALGGTTRRPKSLSVSTCSAIAWFDENARVTGDKMPFLDGAVRANRSRDSSPNGSDSESSDESDKVNIRLPYSTKQDVFSSYRSFCEAKNQIPVSQGHFNRLWRANFPKVKLAKMKGTFAMCGTCADYDGKIKSAVTAAQKEKIWLKKEAHLEKQSHQRIQYYKIRQLAVSQPGQVISLIIDGMDQGKTSLPLLKRRAKGDKVQFMKQKIMGVIAHGHGSYIYISQPPLRSGANFTLECLWRTLIALEAEYDRMGVRFPTKFCIQMDNAGDNKAHAVIAYIAYLVEEGYASEIELNFLIVGHTHEDIDQLFSSISSRFSRLVSNRVARTVISFQD